jgi:hypothetical protein
MAEPRPAAQHHAPIRKSGRNISTLGVGWDAFEVKILIYRKPDVSFEATLWLHCTGCTKNAQIVWHCLESAQRIHIPILKKADAQ